MNRALGWWLSMKKEDSFYKRLQPLDRLPSIMNRRNRFARDEKTADKTLGFILVRICNCNDKHTLFLFVNHNRIGGTNGCIIVSS